MIHSPRSSGRTGRPHPASFTFLGGTAAALLGLGAPVADADAQVTAIALSGSQVPDANAGTEFLFFDAPTINASGEIAFSSILDGSPGGNAGVFRSRGGTLVEVARAGEQAPGANPGVVFEAFEAPLLSDSGDVAFLGLLSGAGADSLTERGIFLDSGGVLGDVARSLAEAPGSDGNPIVFTRLGSPRLDASGQVVFEADRLAPGAAGGAASTPVGGVFRGGTESLTEVARQGLPVPGAGAGVVFESFASPAIAGSGQTVFSAGLAGPGVDASNGFGLFREAAGTVVEVAREGAAAPGSGAGVVFDQLSFDPTTNAAGQTAFLASLAGEGFDSSNNLAVFSEGAGGLTEIARQGQQAPGEASGITFESFGNPVISITGETAFAASLIGPDSVFDDLQGIYRAGSEGLVQVVGTDAEVPGGAPGDTFNFLFDPLLNASGQVAFEAVLASADGTDFSTALYATNLDGELVEIVREGDSVNVSNDPLAEDFRTLTGFLFSFAIDGDSRSGLRNGFNDLGQVVFEASFDDGSSGVFVSNVVAVPEPTTAALLALGGAALLGRRRSA